MPRKAKARTKYSTKMKQTAVRLYRDGTSIEQVAKRFKIPSPSIIYKWASGEGLDQPGGKKGTRRKANGHDLAPPAPEPPPLVLPEDAMPMTAQIKTHESDPEFSQLTISGTVPTKVALHVLMMLNPKLQPKPRH